MLSNAHSWNFPWPFIQWVPQPQKSCLHCSLPSSSCFPHSSRSSSSPTPWTKHEVFLDLSDSLTFLGFRVSPSFTCSCQVCLLHEVDPPACSPTECPPLSSLRTFTYIYYYISCCFFQLCALHSSLGTLQGQCLCLSQLVSLVSSCHTILSQFIPHVPCSVHQMQSIRHRFIEQQL